jgi:hypothetical protein
LQKKVFERLLVILAIVLFLAGCDYKPASFGDFQKIIVYADSMLYKEIQTELEQTFDQFVYTPHLERSFYLDLQPFHTLNTYQTRRNILFVGLLDGKDEVSSFMNSALSAQVKQSISNGRVFEIFQKDIFATEQVVMFFPGTHVDSIKKNLSNRKDIIFNRLDRWYFERLENAMFLKGEQIALEEYLSEKYGWKIRIQHDYELINESEDGNFVWIRRLNPDRSLFVYRFSDQNYDESGDWIYDLRDSLTTVYYEADSILKEDTYLRYMEFQRRSAIKLTGVWQNHKHFIGGPFSTYALHDTTNNYTYIIDLTVTAPGQRKKNLLDQLEVMAHSFKLIGN